MCGRVRESFLFFAIQGCYLLEIQHIFYYFFNRFLSSGRQNPSDAKERKNKKCEPGRRILENHSFASDWDYGQRTTPASVHNLFGCKDAAVPPRMQHRSPPRPHPPVRVLPPGGRRPLSVTSHTLPCPVQPSPEGRVLGKSTPCPSMRETRGVHAPLQPPLSGLAHSPRQGSSLLVNAPLPIPVAPSSSPSSGAHSHSPSTCASGSPLSPRRKAAAPRCPPFTPLPAPHPVPSSSSSFGERPHSTSTCEPRAVTPLPDAPPPPLARAPPTAPGARAQEYLATPPPAWRRSPPASPAQRAVARSPPLAASFSPPPPSPGGGGGHERARWRGQWALGLLWPLPRAAANRGRRWWLILWSGVWMPPLPRAGAARPRGLPGYFGKGA